MSFSNRNFDVVIDLAIVIVLILNDYPTSVVDFKSILQNKANQIIPRSSWTFTILAERGNLALATVGLVNLHDIDKHDKFIHLKKEVIFGVLKLFS